MTVLGADRRVAALGLARAADAFGNSFLVIVLPLYVASDRVAGTFPGLSEAATIGVLLAVLGFVNSGLQPLTGRASDRAGRRRAFVLAGLALLALANLAYSWATSLPALLGLRVVQGVALALAIPATLALVSEVATVGTRGTSMGVYNTLRLVGYGIGPIAAGLVVQSGPYPVPGLEGAWLSGFQAAFLVASLSAAVGFLVVGRLVRDPKALSTEATPDLSVRVRAREEDRWLDPVFVLGVATLVAAVSISLIASIENEVNARLTQSPAMFGLQFSAFLVPHVLLQTPVGRLSDRVGRWPFVVGGLVVAVPATLAQGFVTEPWHLLAARAFQGLATVLFFAPGLAMAGDLAEEGTAGTTMSVMTMAFGFGVAVGPLAGGALVGFGFAAPFAAGAAALACVAVLAAGQLEETAGASAGLAAEQPDEVGRADHGRDEPGGDLAGR